MKFTKLLATVAIILGTVTSCAKNEVDLSNYGKYKTDSLTESVYYIDEEVYHIYPYNNCFYTINQTGGDVGKYDIGTKTYDIICTVPAENLSSIAVNDSGIYTCDENNVYFINIDGVLQETVAIPEVDRENLVDGFKTNYIGLNQTSIAVGCQCLTENSKGEKSFFTQLMLIDLTDAEKIIQKTDIIIEEATRQIIPADENQFYIKTSEKIYLYNPEDNNNELINDSANSFKVIDSQSNLDILYTFTMQGNMGVNTSGISLAEIDLKGDKYTITRNLDYKSIFPSIKNAVTSAGREVKEIEFSLSDTIFFADNKFILFDNNNKCACVLNPYCNDTGESIKVIARNSPTDADVSKYADEKGEFLSTTKDINMTRINMAYENEKGVIVNTDYYDYDGFGDRMRLKLLAGDDDYDVVLLDGAQELLSSILKYNLYLPLENYEKITSGFDKCIDGVVGAATYDGHIYGIPYSMSTDSMLVQQKFFDAGYTLPNSDYTLDEFWTMCENAGTMFINDGAKIFGALIKSVIEDGCEKGEILREALVDCITKMKKYTESGTIDKQFGLEYDIISDNGVAGGTAKSRDMDGVELAALRSAPSYNGKRYIDIISMVYVNSKTKNADNAVDYIAFLLSDDFLAEQFHHSYIAKDLDSYFSYQPPKTINKDKTITIDYDAVAEEYKWRKYPSEMGMTNTFLVQNGSDIFTNAAPRLYTYSLDKFLDGIYSQLTTLTPEEAADAILKEANYKLME